MCPIEYTLHLAFTYYLFGEPFPCDIFMILKGEGFDPSEVYERFMQGDRPSDLLEPEIEVEFL